MPDSSYRNPEVVPRGGAGLLTRSGEIRIGPVAPIREVLRGLGVEPGPVLARAGLEPRLLENPDNRVDFDLLGRVVNAAVEATACPHFGLLLGQHFSPATMGLVYQLMRHSATVRDGLRALVLRLHVHDRGGIPYVTHPSPGEVALVYGIYHRGGYDLAPLHDVALAITTSFMRELCGPRWQPLRVTFPYRRPANLAPYRRFFGTTLLFDAEQASVVFDARWLDAPIPGADPVLRSALEQLVRETETAEALPFADRVRRVLRAMVLSGQATAEHVAFMFAMSRRSLHRQLSAEGTSLQQLVNETRFDVARQLLSESDMPAGEIAAALRYADASAFSRAFKAWSGISPRDWRLAERRTKDSR